MYVVYKVGVYRHDTVAFGLTFDELWPSILDCFSKEDDYHSLGVDYLSLQTGKIEEVCRYEQKSVEVKVTNGRLVRSVIHGDRHIYKGKELVCTYNKVYELKPDEAFL